jgi:hypothetical protein
MESTDLNSDRPIRGTGRASSFLRMTGGVSLVRYWGVSDACAASSQALLRAAAADEPMTRERVARSNQPPSRFLESASR